MSLSMENEAVLLLTKCNPCKEEQERMRKIMYTHLDWSQVTGLLCMHKVAGLAWRNIYKYVLLEGNEKPASGQMLQLVENMYHLQKIKGEAQCHHTLEICRVFNDHKIPHLILKGLVLGWEVYKDCGYRNFNDNDLLIHPQYLKQALELLKSRGYIQGRVNKRTKQIIPRDRREILTRPLVSHEVIPLLKETDEPFLDVHEVDMHFSIDLMSNVRTDEIVQDMQRQAIHVKVGGQEVSTLNWVHHLMFLCIHFYREATTYDELMAYGDLNLYKLCDIQTLMQEIPIDWDHFIDLVKECGFEKEVYYTFHYIKEIYGFSVPGIMDRLRPDDITYIDNVYRYNSDEVVFTHRDSILKRVFDMNRPAALLVRT